VRKIKSSQVLEGERACSLSTQCGPGEQRGDDQGGAETLREGA